jgi:hypothetical protein
MSSSPILRLRTRALLFIFMCAGATACRPMRSHRGAVKVGVAAHLLLLALIAMAATGTLTAQSFSPPDSYFTGDNPIDAAIGDFNGDGKLDMAVTNTFSNNVTVLLNKGDGTGTFHPPVPYTADIWPTRIVTGDFNNDGKLDLANANNLGGDSSTGSISILLGNGNGTFQAPLNYAAPSLGGLGVADLNSDGKLDLITASNDGSAVNVRLGNGNGTFQNAVSYPLSIHPTNMVLCDFNGDGKFDLALTRSAEGVNSNILLGNGDGTFQAASSFAAGATVWGMNTSDLNGDNKQDLILGGSTIDTDSVLILLGNGNGTFQNAVTYPVGHIPGRPQLSDLNGDGKLDVIVINTNDNNSMSILRGNGNGTFQPAVTSLVRFGSYTPVVADFNNDGKPDLLIMDNALDVIDVRLNSPSPHPVAINASPGASTTVLVGTFIDYDETKTASSFTATINWGDGTGPSAGTVVANGPKNFNVTGTHTYALGGSYTVNVLIADDSGNFATITSAATVGIATSTTVTSSANPSDSGQSVTLTATVTSTSGTPSGTPSGTVQFKDNGVNLGPAATLNLSGVATFTTSGLASGTHPITADYAGTNFGSSSGTLSGGQVVKSQLSINDVSITEGDGGTKSLTFTITLSAASSLTVGVNCATVNGSATAPSDYTAVTNATLSFAPGDTSKTISVTIDGDTAFEADETLFVNLSSPVNATIADSQGRGTILNDDTEGGFIGFSQPNYAVSESGGSIIITVQRTGNLAGPATVDYATSADSGLPCGTAGGTASPKCDFTATLGTLRFAAGENSKTIMVLISQDSFVEGVETFNVNISNLTGGAVLSGPSATTVTITDDATEPASNAIDDASNFVRQNYHDFLNREPDASGLAFWTEQITSCGSDQACIDFKRMNVSAAFFLSIEFQGTGYLVERLYKTSYGDVSAASTFGGAHQLLVPVVRFSEFLPDTQEIGQGVVVGQPGWEAALESKKQAFLAAFVQRARFATTLPTSKTPAEFVDQLNTNAGNVLSGTERATAIGLFGSASDSSNLTARAQALRQVAEDPDFTTAEFNRAFVLMQYFGYLRRNPNDPQDTDYSGYEFWLTKLNQFNGNYVSADMVKAFITAGEYRQHFGP